MIVEVTRTDEFKVQLGVVLEAIHLFEGLYITAASLFATVVAGGMIAVVAGS